jgi:hypothetical protein
MNRIVIISPAMGRIGRIDCAVGEHQVRPYTWIIGDDLQVIMGSNAVNATHRNPAMGRIGAH